MSQNQTLQQQNHFTITFSLPLQLESDYIQSLVTVILFQHKEKERRDRRI
jgi:hypothetical protein